MNSQVTVAIEWEESPGKTYRTAAHTQIVSRQGCLLVAPVELRLDQRVRLTNLRSQQTMPAIVVWKGKEGAEGWELGLELSDPQQDFWGLEM